MPDFNTPSQRANNPPTKNETILNSSFCKYKLWYEGKHKMVWGRTYLTFYWKEEESDILKGLGPACCPSGTSCCHHTSRWVIRVVLEFRHRHSPVSPGEGLPVSEWVSHTPSSFHMLRFCFLVILVSLVRSGRSPVNAWIYF